MHALGPISGYCHAVNPRRRHRNVLQVLQNKVIADLKEPNPAEIAKLKAWLTVHWKNIFNTANDFSVKQE